jgi:hypothetical protein
MKASIVILIGAVVIAVLVLTARESTRVGVEQVGSSAASPERLPVSTGTEQMGSLANAAEDAPQGHEQGGRTPKDQVQTGKNVYEHRPPLAAELFDELVSPNPSGMPDPVAAFHQRFSQETPDPSWSPNVEYQLQSYLQNEETTKLFDIVSMECRKTVCEIRAVAPSKELNAQSLEALNNRIFTMPKESWWTGYGLKVPAVSVTTAPDGRSIMVAHVATDW